jgi:choice-of-anchor A domain-containing protein
LFDYNAVVRGTLDINSEVEGRTFVNNLVLSGSAQFGIKPSATGGNASLDKLSVANTIGGSGNINGSPGVFRSSFARPGNINFNANGGTYQVVPPPTLPNLLAGLSAQMFDTAAFYNGKPNTPGASFSTAGNVLSFTPAYDPAGISIINIPASALTTQNLQYNNPPSVPVGKALIINVTGVPSTLNWQVNANGSNALGQNVLWIFQTASNFNLNLNARWVGSILAPTANLSNVTAIEGGVYVNNFVQRGEVHLPLPNNTVRTPPITTEIPIPEPTALGLLVVPACALARRRRV